MTDVFDRLLEVASRLLDIVAGSDLFSLSITLVIFWNIGSYAVLHYRPALRPFGLGSGLVAFVSYLLWAAHTSDISSGWDLADASIRGLFFAGFCTGIAWTIAVAATFLYEHSIGHASRILDSENR